MPFGDDMFPLIKKYQGVVMLQRGNGLGVGNKRAIRIVLALRFLIHIFY